MNETIMQWARSNGLSDDTTLELLQLIERENEQALQAADAAGYLRGRNEKIEIENRF
ncbi:MAG: hypothetical protein HUK12_05205 [Muribaculaceae bacterium]|nr:hypothetical protein [Muribaculaceae bacterium]